MKFVRHLLEIEKNQNDGDKMSEILVVMLSHMAEP